MTITLSPQSDRYLIEESERTGIPIDDLLNEVLAEVLPAAIDAQLDRMLDQRGGGK